MRPSITITLFENLIENTVFYFGDGYEKRGGVGIIHRNDGE